MEKQKIYPSVDRLATVCNLVYCTEEGCQSVFKSESNLNLHLAKTHKKQDLLKISKNVIREYYCPNTSCVYNLEKHFKSLKLLKQHFLKVHSEKNILCDKCNKGFPTEALRNGHKEFCGIIFNCCECSASYPCYDTLQTHGRRKKHKILAKQFYKPINSSAMYFNANLVTNNEPVSEQSNESTQFTIGTQTELLSSKHAMNDIETSSLGTQTFNLPTNLLDCQIQQKAEDKIFEFNDGSSQTTTCNSLEDFDSSNYFNSNSETQTDFIFNSEFSSDTCTQTEGILDKELGFSNIHTQTVLDDNLISVGSQTLKPLNKDGYCTYVVHIETQTEIIQQILEEINA